METFNKKYLIISISVFILVILGWVYVLLSPDETNYQTRLDNSDPFNDPFNMAYEIGGKTYNLKAGVAEES